jgi:hypothetical protein
VRAVVLAGSDSGEADAALEEEDIADLDVDADNSMREPDDAGSPEDAADAMEAEDAAPCRAADAAADDAGLQDDVHIAGKAEYAVANAGPARAALADTLPRTHSRNSAATDNPSGAARTTTIPADDSPSQDATAVVEDIRTNVAVAADNLPCVFAAEAWRATGMADGHTHTDVRTTVVSSVMAAAGTRTR